jgi:hypothetical protein
MSVKSEATNVTTATAASNPGTLSMR